MASQLYYRKYYPLPRGLYYKHYPRGSLIANNLIKTACAFRLRNVNLFTAIALLGDSATKVIIYL